MRFQKIWGETQEIHPCVWLMIIKEGGFSSDHKHDDMVNKFVLVSGKLKIVSKPLDSGKEVETVLTKLGDSVAVPPGVLHRFECIEQAVCVESYFPYEPGYDISRNNVGGINEDNTSV